MPKDEEQVSDAAMEEKWAKQQEEADRLLENPDVHTPTLEEANADDDPHSG